jgi:Ca2+-binding EF-hand superfamily protein
MKKLFVAAALGAAVMAAPAIAQNSDIRVGGFMRDQTRAEAQQRADMMFKRLDANGDGTVTRAEAEQVAQQFGGGDDSNGGRGGGRIAMMINRAFGDAQSITLTQFETQALARFDAMDLNHDGTVSVAERQQARAQRQAQQTPGQ